MPAKQNILSLSIDDTLVLKGIAIIAMLFHHVYAFPPDVAEPYTGVLLWLGALGKVCVALFLFCSGYGLSVQFAKNSAWRNALPFVVKRLIKFYTNYWVVFLIFVPLSIVFFHRPLIAAYGEHVNLIERLIYDLLGVQGFQSYNITWWFNRLIISLYLFFPPMYKLCKHCGWLMLLLSMLLLRYAHHIPYDWAGVSTWLLPFVSGVLWQQKESVNIGIASWLSKHKWLSRFMALVLVVLMIVLRMNTIIPHWSGIRMDGFLSVSIAMLVLAWADAFNYLRVALIFMGKHSMNIYLIHTFFNGYWFPEFFHTSTFMRTGGGNLLILLMLCVVASLLLEWLKEKTGIYCLISNIIGKINKTM